MVCGSERILNDMNGSAWFVFTPGYNQIIIPLKPEGPIKNDNS